MVVDVLLSYDGKLPTEPFIGTPNTTNELSEEKQAIIFCVKFGKAYAFRTKLKSHILSVRTPEDTTILPSTDILAPDELKSFTAADRFGCPDLASHSLTLRYHSKHFRRLQF